MTSQPKHVRWVELPSVRDPRGVLTAVEGGQDVPFEIQRIFYMHHVLSDRGGHSHIDTDQVIVAAHGSFKVDTSTLEDKATFELADPTRGLFVAKLIFTRLYDFSPDAVCLVMSSTHYDMKRSLRNWDDYAAFMKKDHQS